MAEPARFGPLLEAMGDQGSFTCTGCDGSLCGWFAALSSSVRRLDAIWCNCLPVCASFWRWLALTCVNRKGMFWWLANWCSGMVRARFENLPEVAVWRGAGADSL